MAKIEIYVTETCPYCVKAKDLLKRKNVDMNSIKIIDVSNDEELRASMMKRANGRRTVPQIFIDNKHIGGCDDLYALDDKGGLDILLVN